MDFQHKALFYTAAIFMILYLAFPLWLALKNKHPKFNLFIFFFLLLQPILGSMLILGWSVTAFLIIGAINVAVMIYARNNFFGIDKKFMYDTWWRITVCQAFSPLIFFFYILISFDDFGIKRIGSFGKEMEFIIIFTPGTIIIALLTIIGCQAKITASQDLSQLRPTRETNEPK